MPTEVHPHVSELMIHSTRTVFFITAAVRHCSYSLACKQPRGCPIVVAEHWQLILGALGMIPDGCQFVSFLYFLWQ